MHVLPDNLIVLLHPMLRYRVTSQVCHIVYVFLEYFGFNVFLLLLFL